MDTADRSGASSHTGNQSSTISQPDDSRQAQKPVSFTNLIKSKFKRAKSNHKLKGKKSKEQKSMVRSISIAFNEDAYASQKSQPESISNLYQAGALNDSNLLNNSNLLNDANLLNDSNRSNLTHLNDSNSSTNLNDESKSTLNEPRPKKANKLQKLREKFRSKFKLKANSLEDRSTTNLDDSLEQASEEDKQDGAIEPRTVATKFNGDLTASGRILDLFDADLDALSNRTKANLKLRPKSEVFSAGDQPLRNLNKNHRFTTIEVGLY